MFPTVHRPNGLRAPFLRLPESMLDKLKLLANKNDVPYQSLVKVFLSDRIDLELQKHTPHKTKH